MKIPLEPLRGFRDILVPDSTTLRRLMTVFRELVESYGYEEVIPPTLERFELFAIKSGEEIRRSMFVFRDKAGREVALRPEATASIARIYLKHLRAKPKPIRLYYIVNCFRYEEPQRARYREFWQAGIELLGAEGKVADIETINLLINYYEKIKMLDKIVLKIGNIGIYRSIFKYFGLADEEQDHILHLMDKSMYDEALSYLEQRGLNELANKLQELWNTSTIEDAAKILATINKEAEKQAEYLIEITNIIRDIYPNLALEPDISFARGLAYYTGIIFEVKVPGFPVSIAGGGRYDNLIEIYGDEHVPGVGFAIGLDRTLAALKEKGIDLKTEKREKATVVLIDEKYTSYAIKLQQLLASKHIVTDIVTSSRISKTLQKIYEKGTKYAIILGEKEAKENKVTIKDLETRKQVIVRLDKLEKVERLSNIFE